MGPCIVNILQYISKNMQLYIVYLYLETALHVSGGTSTYYQERIQLYLQHLVFVRPLLLSAAIAADSSNGVANTRCCRYSCMHSWKWVEVPPEICRAVSRYKKNVTCYNQMIVAIVDMLTSFNFFPRSIQSVIFFSTFFLLRC
jgi:hypothetical protein